MMSPAHLPPGRRPGQSWTSSPACSRLLLFLPSRVQWRAQQMLAQCCLKSSAVPWILWRTSFSWPGYCSGECHYPNPGLSLMKYVVVSSCGNQSPIDLSSSWCHHLHGHQLIKSVMAPYIPVTKPPGSSLSHMSVPLYLWLSHAEPNPFNPLCHSGSKTRNGEFCLTTWPP